MGHVVASRTDFYGPLHSRYYSSGRPSPKQSSSTLQKDRIRRNVFRVRSLKVDYSGHSLFNLPFTNLTRFCMDCRYGCVKYPTLEGIVTVEKDQQFKEAALLVIAQNCQLQHIDISYIENLADPRVRNLSLPPFADRLLQALQQPHQQHQSSSSSSSISVSNSSLYSMKLVCHGNQSLEDLCSIIENCPSSLKELTLHSHYSDQYYPSIITDPTPILQRLESIKNNSNSNSSIHPASNPASRQHRIPSLRLLNISWNDLEEGSELEFHNAGLFLYSLLSCFPDLQELYVPFGVTLQYNSEGRLSPNGTDAAFISTLALNCPVLTTINFGHNLITEEQMFRFVKIIPEALQELTTGIEPNYLDRVIPTLLRRSGPSLQVLRLKEQDFDGSSIRSTYIADIVSSCPRLKSLVVLPPWRYHMDHQGTNVGLQDLLNVDWICSGLETLSIGIMDLAEYQVEQEIDKDGNHSPLYHNDEEFALYLRKTHNVTEFHRRLKSITPSLQNPSLTWSYHCQDIPYDPYSHDIDFPNNLRWMNLKWLPVYGVFNAKTTAQEVAIQRQLEKKSDLALQRKLQDSGIFVSEIRMGAYANHPFRSSWYYDWWWKSEDWDRLGADYFDEEVSFEDVQDAYKSRSSRRLHEEMKRRK